MSTEPLNAEQQALQSLVDLLDEAKRCRELFERAGMTLPEPLRRILGMNESGTKASGRMLIPAPERKSHPPGVQPDWISIAAKDSSPTSVVLAILRGAGTHVRAKLVIDQVTAILPDVSRGSIANIGSRLDDDLIRRTKEDGWLLIKPERAGVLFDARIWGPPTIFGKIELAAHRREGILHLLSFFEGGLQVLQILERLRTCEWIHAPLSKELVQDDMEFLYREDKVRRRGNTKKWEIAPDLKGGGT